MTIISYSSSVSFHQRGNTSPKVLHCEGGADSCDFFLQCAEPTVNDHTGRVTPGTPLGLSRRRRREELLERG